jgi:hypothetical protein
MDTARTGAKNLENGTPWLRAKDHNCLDAAAREAIPEAAKLNIKTVVMRFVAARL